MAITDKEQGVWGLEEVYNKINEGDIWKYTGQQEMWNWGYSTDGMVGRNNLVSLSSPTQLPGTTWSRSYGTTPSTNKISGDRPQYAIKTDGTFWSWGGNYNGSLGQNNSNPARYSSPTQVGTDTTWKGVSTSVCNMVECSAWKTDGSLWTWGANNKGQLGHNNKTDYSSPKQVPGSYKVAVAAQLSSMAIKTDGTFWSWGYNDYGQLGHNNKSDYSSPKQVGTDTTWDEIQGAHSDQVYVTKTDGSLWAWGRNHQGQLGQNNRTDYSSPRQIPGDFSGAGFSIAYHAQIAVKNDGTLWSWGYQSYGELGQNQASGGARSSPVQIGSDTDWDPDGISGGGFQSMGCVKTDGSMYLWGRNLGGVLGINEQGNNKSRSSPTQIPGTIWSSLRIAGRTSYATKTL